MTMISTAWQRMADSKIALALGSGAARGWAHIGVIEALVEAGVEPAIVCGTSMGALVGSFYAAGRLGDLKKWALGADWRTVGSLIDVRLSGGGLVVGQSIVDWLGTFGLGSEIQDLSIPYAAVATSLETGREEWLRSGPLDAAIRASIAMPGIFSPVKLIDHWMVDGSLVNPVPVSVARALGADFIIAVNVGDDFLARRSITPATKSSGISEFMQWARALTDSSAERVVAPRYFDVLANSLNIMQDQIMRSRLAGEPPHAQISPHVTSIGPLDFHKAEVAIAAGRAATELALPMIKDKLQHREA